MSLRPPHNSNDGHDTSLPDRAMASSRLVSSATDDVSENPTHTSLIPKAHRPLILHIMTVPLSFLFLRGQIQFMKSRGYDISLVSSPGELLTKFATEAGVASYGIPMRRRISPLRDAIALFRLVALIRTLNPSVVHAHTPKAGLLGVVAASLAGVPVRVYHMRGLPFLTAKGMRRAALRLSEFVACRLAHRVICVSESVRQIAVRRGLVDAAQIVVLANGSGNGVDAEDKFNPSRLAMGLREQVRANIGAKPSDVVIGFAGRLVRDKGIVELEEAWQLIRDQVPQARLLLVGPFEDQDPIPAEVRRSLSADPRVHLAGVDWEISRLYAAMDIFVLPSYREGFPNGVLEASAMELPVIASRVPGCVDAVAEGETGALVPARDSHTLACTILTYVTDEPRRLREGQAGRRRVLRLFRPQLIWEALELEYGRLLAKSGVPVVNA